MAPAANRMTIYVGEALRARIDATPDINWSSVAQTAFEREMARHEWKGDPAMREAIARLKAERQEEADAGRTAGMEWAQTASYAALLTFLDIANEVEADDTKTERDLQGEAARDCHIKGLSLMWEGDEDDPNKGRWEGGNLKTDLWLRAFRDAIVDVVREVSA